MAEKTEVTWRETLLVVGRTVAIIAVLTAAYIYARGNVPVVSALPSWASTAFLLAAMAGAIGLSAGSVFRRLEAEQAARRGRAE